MTAIEITDALEDQVISKSKDVRRVIYQTLPYLLGKGEIVRKNDLYFPV